ncbi:hybrid sensor histidine kinase/response regulator [Alteromonas lipolytica]|uniref:hybrid sensor histidine kinase/response regulator n=1 Tax=Alteromonas lipolytica TaxID=1856405 RepID=UPI001E31E99D|nr:hybrid sensor histidine kinase/response regulator [Alteromonas lipolytica]
MLCWLCTPAYAAVHLYDGEQTQLLADNFAIQHETGGAFTIRDIMKRRHDFTYQADNNPNYGFSDKGLWLHTELSNLSNNEDWAFSLNFSQLDKVDFYLVVDDEVIAQSHQGKLQPEQVYRIPLFKATIPIGEKAELFIRVQSNSSSLIVPIYVMSEASEIVISQIDNLAWGLFYGGLFILAIYNLVLFLGSREQSLIGYVAYILTVLLWQFVWGGHITFFFPETLSPLLTPYTSLIFSLIGISSGIFSVIFLETRTNSPSMHSVVVAFLWLQAAMGITTLIDIFPPAWEHNLVYGIGMFSIISYIAAGFEAYAKHYRPARYFIFAWGILAVGAIVGMLSLIGVVPSNMLTTYCFQVAVFCEAGLFSIALMEKSRSQLESEVNQATDELRHNMELIEEQNARLDIARKDAIKASNVKSQFLANMSHEIRTPLNAILGFSKELTNLTLPVDKMEQVRIINTAADNLLTIVNDVLDFSKIEAGKLQINNQPFSPNSLIEEMVTIMSKSAHMKGLEFVLDLGPLPEKLIGDVFRIRQILNNLLSNALKFTSYGHIKLAVHGKALQHGIHELVIKVEDTGIGISRKDKNKLFSAFSQIDDALNRSYQGTGLGLVICQELVKLMRGNLALKTAPGQGSTFTVTLRTNQLSQRYSLSPLPEWQNKRVLLFDPHPVSRRASAHMMKSLGARVYCVETLDYLQTLNDHFDYLFAVLPAFKATRREQMLEALCVFNADKRVLWYSGDEPLSHFPAYMNDFEAQIRMPLTISKLDGLLHGNIKEKVSPQQSKLNALPKARILAVDDMDMNLKLLDTWLADSPVQLTLCSGGQEAVNRCKNNEYDLILMDVQMPGMDGLQATRHIRKTTLNGGTPIIAVTAHAFKEEQERLLSSGMDDYLPKPIEFSTLLNLIKRWCQGVDNSPMALPSLDWQQALKRANQNRELAMELLSEFVRHLPLSTEAIRREWDARNFKGVQDEIHKLHGACCYTGVPKLQQLANEMESALKLGNHYEASELLPTIILECEIAAAQANKFIQDNKSA